SFSYLFLFENQPTTSSFLFFFNAPPTTEIYTLSLHDALPISRRDGECRSRWPSGTSTPASRGCPSGRSGNACRRPSNATANVVSDRKSTRLNSSHVAISYAVFCLKKKKENKKNAERSQNNKYA